MGKELAIKGHQTRGEEVIELLKMMGGKNPYQFNGDKDCAAFVIDIDKNIRKLLYIFDDEYMLFTLEEFLKEYPFKVGDKVHIYVQNDDTDGRYDVEVAEISSMRWNRARCKIAYKMKDINREFYKEEIKCKVDDSTKSIDNPIDSSQFMQLGKTVAVCFNTANYENEVELKLGDYEIVVRGGRTYAVLKKPAYPKTYEECCKVLRISPEFLIKYSVDGSDTERDAPLIRKFIKLKRCRDVYWKIAGEEMGLGKPWEPDWNDSTRKCTIVVIGNDLVKHYTFAQNFILAFPTEEMRDVFYENFKDLIEGCKELL